MAVGQGGFYTNNLTISASPVSESKSALVAVDIQAPNGSAPQTLAIPLGLMSQSQRAAIGIVAHAGGTQAAAFLLDYGFSSVDTVATAADSVKLPPAIAGSWCVIENSSAASMQVFGGGTSTINGVATATGVAQAAGKSALYFCASGVGDDVAGVWYRLLSA